MVARRGIGEWRRLRLAAFALWLVGWSLFLGACVPAGPVNYVYDENDRLLAASDPSNTAIYSYDQVGNITGIAVQPTTTVTLLAFAPPCGVVGTTVTIYGTGFNPTANQNTVTFMGATGVPATSASGTQLVVPIPSGATTGQVAVTVAPATGIPGGTANSGSKSFRVDGCGAPDITDVTTGAGVSCATEPVGGVGQAVTLIGTNFSTVPVDNRVLFNNHFATVGPPNPTATQLYTKVPQGGTSGKIRLNTAAGGDTSPCDFFVPPPGYQASDVDLANSGRMGDPTTNGGVSYSLTVPTNPKVGLTLFDGVGGGRACLKITGTDLANSSHGADQELYDPDAALVWNGCIVGCGSGNTVLFDAAPLPKSGTYALLTKRAATTTGTSLTWTLYGVKPDLHGTLTPGTALQITTETACQNALLTFPGTQGHRASAVGTTPGLSPASCYTLAFKKADGSTLPFTGGVPPCPATQAAFLETNSALATSGTYTLLVDPSDVNVGAVSVTVYDVVDVVGSIPADGTATPATITTPGQNLLLTFNGSVGQRVSALVTQWTGSGPKLFRIVNSSGVTVKDSEPGATFIDAVTLTTAGTYTLRFDPFFEAVGNVTLKLFTVPADDSHVVTMIPGSALVTVSTPGQNAIVAFEGAASQQVTLTLTNHMPGCANVKWLPPGGGSPLFDQPVCGTPTNPTRTLPVQGTYTISIDPQNESTGTMDVSVS